MADLQDKVQMEGHPHAEHVDVDPNLKIESEVLLKSSLDDLGLLATVKRFWKVCYFDFYL